MQLKKKKNADLMYTVIDYTTQKSFKNVNENLLMPEKVGNMNSNI